MALLFPVALIFGAIAGILLHKIIGWYIEGTISGLECALIGGLYIGLVVSILTLKLVIAGMLFLALIFFLVMPNLMGKHSAQKFEDNRINLFRQTITADPTNLAARSKLASALHGQGKLDEAIQELTELVSLAPNDTSEVYRLKQYNEEKEHRQLSPIICPSCGHANSPERTRCEECEGNLRLSNEIKEWLAHGGLKQIAVSTAITIAIITVIAFGLSALSAIGKVCVIALILIIVILAQLIHAYRNS